MPSRHPVPSRYLSERTAGLVLEVMAVFLIFILAGAVLGLGRSRRSASGRRIGRVRSMDWRVVAIALLMGFVAEEWSLLRTDYSTGSFPVAVRLGSHLPGPGEPVSDLRAPGDAGPDPGHWGGWASGWTEVRRPRPYWLFVPLAALAALLFLAQPGGWWSVVPQLVLVA